MASVIFFFIDIIPIGIHWYWLLFKLLLYWKALFVILFKPTTLTESIDVIVLRAVLLLTIDDPLTGIIIDYWPNHYSNSSIDPVEIGLVLKLLTENYCHYYCYSVFSR